MALSFGETITTDTTTLTVPVCSIVPTTFHIIKQVNGGILPASVFTLHLTFSGIDVLGSPFSGAVFPGAPYTLDTGEYVVSEGLHSGYVQSFSGDCSSSGHVTLYPADDKTCIIINTFIPPVVQISFGGGGGVFPPSMSGTIITINTGITINTITGITVAVPVTGSVTVPQVMVPLAPRLNVSVPLLPDTGVAPQQKDTPWGMIVTISMFIFVSIISFVVVTRKEHI